ncbi:MAG: 4-oxalocrotonate tautomerase family protein [Burkholderiaceae bacterium]|nr:MAG: 4-oxalocrotonate tautomerase family protein [Burkholderiaceae bacterium]
MPVVTVELLAGRSQEAKNEIAKEVTATLAKHALADPEHVYVVFRDVRPGDWAVAGVCLSNRQQK